MNHEDIRERDRLVKMLRRRPPDPDAPLKPTTAELMRDVFGGIRDEYDQGGAARSDTAKRLWESTGEPK